MRAPFPHDIYHALRGCGAAGAVGLVDGVAICDNHSTRSKAERELEFPRTQFEPLQRVALPPDYAGEPATAELQSDRDGLAMRPFKATVRARLVAIVLPAMLRATPPPAALDNALELLSLSQVRTLSLDCRRATGGDVLNADSMASFVRSMPPGLAELRAEELGSAAVGPELIERIADGRLTALELRMCDLRLLHAGQLADALVEANCRLNVLDLGCAQRAASGGAGLRGRAPPRRPPRARAHLRTCSNPLRFP